MAQHPVSPNGTRMDEMIGEPRDVYQIGLEMKVTGNTMTLAARTLREISDSTSGMHGQAVQKLQDAVGDSHEMLFTAGDLYKNVGEALKTYGWDVIDLKTQMNTHFSNAETAWQELQALPGDKDGRSYGLFGSPPEPGSDEAKQHEAEDAAALAKYEEWEGYARSFEGSYDDWETAWNTATEGVQEAMDDGPKDGWSEWLGVISDILTVVGIIVAIAAIIIGGPIVGLIGAIVGVLSLVVTIAQACLGDKGGWDIFFDVIGVIPFGKALKPLIAGEGGISALKAMNKGFVGGVFSGDGRKALKADWGAFSDGGFKGLYKANNPLGFGDSFTRMITGNSATDFEQNFKDKAGRALIGELFDMQSSLIGNILKHDGTISNFTGHDSIKTQAPWLKFLW